MFAVDHVQRGQQPRQLGVAVQVRAGQGIAGQAGAVEFAVQALADLLQLIEQQFAQLGIRVELLVRRQALQHRQWGFQGMAKVAQGVA
ncbi:hypothetical protein D3C84_1180410 [compost metagenome]